jgi:hypothetical protein
MRAVPGQFAHSALTVLLRVVLVSTACLGPLSAADSAYSDRSAGRQISRHDYADRLRAMWLGETIANWTGLTTEGVKQDAPFYSDADWGIDQHISSKPNYVIDFVLQDPWLADDDTDIEYVYLHLMQQHDTIHLSAIQIRDGWVQHINDPIWDGNQSRRWMEQGALPPVTGMGTVTPAYLMNNAQLITEIFGALAPGMPGQALQLADLPIRATSGGYAAHAAQFHVVLYSLAAQVDPARPPRDQILWMVKEARRYLPDTSKAADVVDFVLADYLANPDVTDWERTRDKVYERYHDHAKDNGFVYRGWLESSVNFATGLIALLYGEGDFRRTVQIGTLSGWDSDNGTATMGGLLGLMLGYEALAEQFPAVTLSDRYNIHRTRETLPDYLPDDPGAEDTFTLMAERMLPLVERTIVEAGGSVDGDVWTLPPASEIDPLSQNPLMQLYQRSANNRVRLEGGTIETGVTGQRTQFGTKVIADGLEHDFSGQEVFRIPQPYRAKVGEEPVTIQVIYDRPVDVRVIRFIEGGSGGFSSMRAEVLTQGTWQPVPQGTSLSQDPDPAVPCQMIDFLLPEPVQVSGIRVIATLSPEILWREISIIELDALSATGP